MNRDLASRDYIRVKVIPNQVKTEFRGEMADGTLKIALQASPEKGKANKELINFLSTELGIVKTEIKIVSGVTSRIKLVRLK